LPVAVERRCARKSGHGLRRQREVAAAADPGDLRTEFAHLAENRGIGFLMPERVTHARSQSTLRVIARRFLDQPLLLGELALQAEQFISSRAPATARHVLPSAA
jgi:hypothetical protein